MPPDPVAVKVTAVPVVPVVGPLIETPRANGLTTIEQEADAVFAFASVTVSVTVNVPFELKVVVKLAPVPDAGEPPVAVQANVYGVVPPEAVAVKEFATPTVLVVEQVNVVERASGATTTELVADCVCTGDE